MQKISNRPYIASFVSHSPHIQATWKTKSCDNLRFYGALQDTQGSIFPMTGQNGKFQIRFTLRDKLKEDATLVTDKQADNINENKPLRTERKAHPVLQHHKVRYLTNYHKPKNNRNSRKRRCSRSFHSASVKCYAA